MGQIRMARLLCTRIALEATALRVMFEYQVSDRIGPDECQIPRVLALLFKLRSTSHSHTSGTNCIGPGDSAIPHAAVLLFKLPLYESHHDSSARPPKQACYFIYGGEIKY